MTRLFIAEKPSLGRAIAAALPNPQKKGDGFIQCGNGDVVTWCIGHLLEQVEPDAYDERYKKWNLNDLLSCQISGNSDLEKVLQNSLLR